MNKDQIKNLVSQIVGIKGATYQLNVAQEEAAEFIQEISKIHRNKGSRTALVSEIADMLNGLESVKKAFAITDEEIQLRQIEKLERTLYRIERKEE